MLAQRRLAIAVERPVEQRLAEQDAPFDDPVRPKLRRDNALVHRRRDSVMQIVVDRRPSQGTPTQEYREYFKEV